MNRNLMSRLSIAAVALVLVLPFTIGCDDDSTNEVISGGLTAAYVPDEDAVDNSITLQASDAAVATPDLFSLDVVVGAVDSINGVALKIHFNQYFVQFVGADFTGSFLQGTLPAAEFDTGAALFAPGVVDVWAARRGSTQAGITMEAGQTGGLCTLTFKVIAATATATGLTIDPDDILVTVCPEGGAACTTVDEITLGGGSVTAE